MTTFKRSRLALGMSIREIAEALGFASERAIYDMDKGTAEPTVAQLLAIERLMIDKLREDDPSYVTLWNSDGDTHVLICGGDWAGSLEDEQAGRFEAPTARECLIAALEAKRGHYNG